MKLEKILKEAVARGASDIYITTGTKPVFRVSGNLVFLEDHPLLTVSVASEDMLDLMSEKQAEVFKSKKDFDFAIEVTGLARFRVNAFVQRKGVGGVLRLIPPQIQTMEELGLPEAFKKIPEF